VIRDLPSAADREERLNLVLLNYVEALEEGRELNRDLLLAENPDLEDDLNAFFTGHDEVERLAAPFRDYQSPVAECRREAQPTNRKHETDGDNWQPELSQHLGQLGDFLLLREVGRGGMGVVYEAEQISLRRRVALKVLPFAAAIDSRQIQRFKNEAMAAAHLRHENIVPVHAVGCERGVHYYAMQFIEGQSLAALIAGLRAQVAEDPNKSTSTGRKAGINTTVPIAAIPTQQSTDNRRYFDWVAGLGRQAAVALEHAHQMGIVHRDIKPGNLLLDPRGQLWVADFGLAQVSGDPGITATGELLGTLRYASPEQALGRRGVVDQRSDVYSLGATLYELLALRPPFDGRDRHELLRQIASDEPPAIRAATPCVPHDLETIVLKALRKEAGERYSTAQELANDLQRFLDHQPILARLRSPAERIRIWSMRHPSAIFASAVMLILLSAGSLLSAALLRQEQARTRTEQLKAEAAYERERLRAEEAVTRLSMAQHIVTELVQVSEEDLANRPGMDGVRQRLLRAALSHYQEFIEQRHEDPNAQAALLVVKGRIERILDDLDVLRSSTRFYLLCQAAVLDDLRLTPDQRTRIKELTARVGKQWADSFQDIGIKSPNERGRRALLQARNNEAELESILSAEQQFRLRQINLQAEGPGAFRDPKVAESLQLTTIQRERIWLIENNTAFALIEKNTTFGPMKHVTRIASIENPIATETKEKATNERLMAVLNEEQKQTWHAMTGEPVKGTLKPFAPFVSIPQPKRDPKR